MARKPNYSFERHERERLKAEKKAKRAAAKKESREKKRFAQPESFEQIDTQNPMQQQPSDGAKALLSED